MKKLISLLALLSLAAVITAAETWKTYSVKDGLISNSITAITVDLDSIWFGTKSGLSRYVKAKNIFENFTIREGLPSNDIVALSANRNNLWIGTTAGVCVFNKDNRQFRSFTKKHGLISERTTAILAAGDDVWIGTNLGISYYNRTAGSFSSYTDKDGLADKHVTSIVSDGTNILVGTVGTSINVFNKLNRSWDLYAPGTPMYTNIVITTQGENVWSGTNGGGVRVYNKQTRKWTSFTRNEGLGDENISSLSSDGIYLWCGTFDGVSRYNVQSKEWKLFSAADGLADASITAIGVDGNFIWFGTDNGATRYNKVIPEARIFLKKTFITNTDEPVEIECTAASYNKIRDYKLEYSTLTFPIVWLEKGVFLPKTIEEGKLFASWKLDDIPSKIDFYNVKLSVTDESGVSNEATAALIIDTVPPLVTINKEKDEYPAGIFTVGGTYNKKTIEKIIVNPGSVKAVLNPAKKTYYAIVNLREGTNLITATARDWIGRSGTAEVIVKGKKDAGDAQAVSITQDDKDPSQSRLTIGEKMLFDPGSAELKASVYPTLDKIADILKKYPESAVKIEGHTDNLPVTGGTYANNMDLSVARAKNVFFYFTRNGKIPAERIQVNGYGETKPVGDNKTESGRALNRRVEIIISGQK